MSKNIPSAPRYFKTNYQLLLFLTQDLYVQAGIGSLLLIVITWPTPYYLVDSFPVLLVLTFYFMFAFVALIFGGVNLTRQYTFSKQLCSYQVTKGKLVALALNNPHYQEALRLRISEKYPDLVLEPAAYNTSKDRGSLMYREGSIARFAFVTADGQEELCFEKTNFEQIKLDNLLKEVHILYDPNNKANCLAYEYSMNSLPGGFTEAGEILYDAQLWSANLHKLRFVVVLPLAFSVLLAIMALFSFITSL